MDMGAQTHLLEPGHPLHRAIGAIGNINKKKENVFTFV